MPLSLFFLFFFSLSFFIFLSLSPLHAYLVPMLHVCDVFRWPNGPALVRPRTPKASCPRAPVISTSSAYPIVSTLLDDPASSTMCASPDPIAATLDGLLYRALGRSRFQQGRSYV
jgi:hypothetical protein